MSTFLYLYAAQETLHVLQTAVQVVRPAELACCAGTLRLTHINLQCFSCPVASTALRRDVPGAHMCGKSPEQGQCLSG